MFFSLKYTFFKLKGLQICILLFVIISYLNYDEKKLLNHKIF